jgi:hypothetical protein
MQFQRKKDFCLGRLSSNDDANSSNVARKSARVSRRKSLALLNFEERDKYRKFRVSNKTLKSKTLNLNSTINFVSEKLRKKN